MSMIFPGMDPYLEEPGVYRGFHHCLAVYMADHFLDAVKPRFVPAVEARRFSYADDAGEIHEINDTYVAILDREHDNRAVTVIEVTTPENKQEGIPRAKYTEHQLAVLKRPTNLVEIDLLRTGSPVVATTVLQALPRFDYLVSVQRAGSGQTEAYPSNLRDRLRRFRIPLTEGEQDIVLSLQDVVNFTYDRGYYRERLRLLYDRPCEPPLSPEDQAWADELIRAARTSDRNPSP